MIAASVALLTVPVPPNAQAADIGSARLHGQVTVACCTSSRLAVGRSAATYAAPLSGRLDVLTTFQPPPTPYAAGHRGVDFAAAQGTTVQAAADGLVRFSGQVAGRGVVVIAHSDGLSTEYEPITPTVHAGDTVSRGQPIGQLVSGHASCAPHVCLHWGARRDEVYLDPLSLLRPLGVVRLVPWD
jgi:murein DD-endopeptidase MepM/ murein hydrolase activator NlpD